MDYFDILLAKKLNGGGTNAIYKQTLTGLPSPIASFTGADAPIDELIVSIDAVQSGSGEPSPTNIRPISGWSSCEVTVTDDLTDPTYTNTYTIPFKDSSDNPITVYGGGIDVTGGKWLDSDAMLVYNGTENWEKNTDVPANPYFFLRLGSTPLYENDTDICSHWVHATVGSTNDNIGSRVLYSNAFHEQRVVIRPSGYADMSVNDFKQFLADQNTLGTPVQFKVVKLTPTEHTFTPTQVRTIQGNNNVFADCGEVTELKYYSETP